MHLLVCLRLGYKGKYSLEVAEACYIINKRSSATCNQTVLLQGQQVLSLDCIVSREGNTMINFVMWNNALCSLGKIIGGHWYWWLLEWHNKNKASATWIMMKPTGCQGKNEYVYHCEKYCIDPVFMRTLCLNSLDTIARAKGGHGQARLLKSFETVNSVCLLTGLILRLHFCQWSWKKGVGMIYINLCETVIITNVTMISMVKHCVEPGNETWLWQKSTLMGMDRANTRPYWKHVNIPVAVIKILCTTAKQTTRQEAMA